MPALGADIVGLQQPEIKTHPPDYYGQTIEKRDFWIIKYPKDDPNGRQLLLNIYETNYAPDSGQLSGPVEEHPWDVIVIMTTDWLLVARPEPQQDVQKANDQAKGIWKVVLAELEKDSSLTTMFCWIISPLDFVLAPNKALNLLGAFKRQAIYAKNSATLGTRFKRKLCVPQNYESHKSVDQSEPELFKFQSRIVIHDKDTSAGMGGPSVSELFPENQYLGHGFPPISCNHCECVLSDKGYISRALDPKVYLWSGPLYE